MDVRQTPGLLRTDATAPSRRRPAFTLTELLVALGLIAVLTSLLLPVLAKTRAAANSARCASNLHQMGLALSLYIAQNEGRVPDYLWHLPSTPDVAWDAYWLGALANRGVKDDVIVCPSAAEVPSDPSRLGYGDSTHCWTGLFASNGSVVRFSDALFRHGSYGYNRYLTTGGFAGRIAKITAFRSTSRVPAFFDCAYVDAAPTVGGDAEPPPDLTGGGLGPGCPEHWKFLLARHGRGINVCMVDGSVSWVGLEDTYVLSWNNDWVTSPLTLPPR